MVVPQYHPLQLANALATLDQLSAGRVILGAGVGWSAAEFARSFGVSESTCRRWLDALEGLFAIKKIGRSDEWTYQASPESRGPSRALDVEALVDDPRLHPGRKKKYYN